MRFRDGGSVALPHKFWKYKYPLTTELQNYSILIFTHLQFCLADAIQNFKGVKIILIWENGGLLFSNIAD